MYLPQFLAGTTPAERDHFNLEDVSDYALLASSGCYRLPSGPFNDDSIAMAELRVALRTLGFKPKHMTSIFSLLVAILLLGNLQFGDAHDISAHVSNPHVLDQAPRLLYPQMNWVKFSPTRQIMFGRNYLLFFWMLHFQHELLPPQSQHHWWSLHGFQQFDGVKKAGLPSISETDHKK